MSIQTASHSAIGSALPHARVAQQRIADLLPGLILVGGLTLAATMLAKSPWLQAKGISSLTVAIVLGMLICNIVMPRIAAPLTLANVPGVTFAKQPLLRLGIILYGLRLNIQDIGQIGLSGVMIDATVLCSTFALSWLIGTRLFKLERQTAMLIGAGSAICGAAAVMATAPVVRGRTEQVTVAVSTVVVFGTLAIFLYPALYHLRTYAPWVTMSPSTYGIFAGSTIHEVAQALAAGTAISAEASHTAVITKLVRVMMLAPFLITLSAYLSRTDEAGAAGTRRRIALPWFALGCVAMAGLNSLDILPKYAVHAAIALDTLLLTMAMGALGLTTQFSAIRHAGLKPLALAALLFVWLLGGGLAINISMHVLFSTLRPV